jgi:hypothetical protein
MDFTVKTKFEDIEFICEDNKSIYFSKYVLAHFSDVFKSLFENVEGNKLDIGESSNHLNILFNFLMKNEFLSFNLGILLKLCDKYEINNKSIQRDIISSTNLYSMAQILEYCLKYKLNTVKVFIESMYKNNISSKIRETTPKNTTSIDFDFEILSWDFSADEIMALATTQMYSLVKYNIILEYININIVDDLKPKAAFEFFNKFNDCEKLCQIFRRISKKIYSTK